MKYTPFLILLLCIFGCGPGNKKKAKNSEISINPVALDTTSDITYKHDGKMRRKQVYDMLSKEREELKKQSLAFAARKDTFECGTLLTEAQYDLMADAACDPEAVPADTTALLRFPVVVTVIAKTLGAVAITDAEIISSINMLNKKFSPIKINFGLKNIKTIKSDKLVNFNTESEAQVLTLKTPGTINIFIFNSIVHPQLGKLNGYTNFNGVGDFLMMTAGAMKNGTTLSHEMGHFFWLYHTHGITNIGSTNELVDGTDCSCLGDDVCDTPADPNLYKKPVDEACRYTGEEKDTKGIAFRPDPSNLMSYAPERCRKIFTKGQYYRMRYAAIKHIVRFNPGPDIVRANRRSR